MNEVLVITNKKDRVVIVNLNGINIKTLPYSEHSNLSQMYVDGFIDGIKKTCVYLSVKTQEIN